MTDTLGVSGDNAAGGLRGDLFRTPEDIVDALCAMPSYFHARSESLMRVRRRGGTPRGEPFAPGFLASIELRAELGRLLNVLDERSRVLLVMWFVQDHPVTSIARRLGISRVHCYRLREKALQEMLDEHRYWRYGGTGTVDR